MYLTFLLSESLNHSIDSLKWTDSLSNETPLCVEQKTVWQWLCLEISVGKIENLYCYNR